MAEASYLNQRFKPKEGNKFVKFTIDEIKQQIRDFIQLEFAVATNLNELLLNSVFSNQQKVVEETLNASIVEMQKISVGTLGTWEGKLGEKQIGMVIEKDVMERHGMVPSDLIQSLQDWVFAEEIKNFKYEEKNNIIYLVF